MERRCTQSKLHTVGTCVCLRLHFSVTARWQMRPQAIIVCLGHSSLHLILSFFILPHFGQRSQEVLLSLLVSIVNYRHLPIEELTSFYSHTKDAFCHLWLLQGTVCGPVSIRRRWENAGKHRRPRHILPASYSYSMHLWQIYKWMPKCARAVPSALLSVRLP